MVALTRRELLEIGVGAIVRSSATPVVQPEYERTVAKALVFATSPILSEGTVIAS